MIYNGWIFLHLNTYKVYTINLSLNASYIEAKHCVAESIRLSLIKDSTPMETTETTHNPLLLRKSPKSECSWVSGCHSRPLKVRFWTGFEVKCSIAFQWSEGFPPHILLLLTWIQFPQQETEACSSTNITTGMYSTEVVLNRNMTTWHLELHIMLGRFTLPTRVGIPHYIFRQCLDTLT